MDMKLPGIMRKQMEEAKQVEQAAENTDFLKSGVFYSVVTNAALIGSTYRLVKGST